MKHTVFAYVEEFGSGNYQLVNIDTVGFTIMPKICYYFSNNISLAGNIGIYHYYSY